MRKIQPEKNGCTKCIECNQSIQRSDEYYWIKQKGKYGRTIFIHKSCYEKLLPKKGR